MSDNIASNPGSGASVRCLADGSGVEWAAGVVAYATTVSAGANVLQVVTPSAGLPVAQQGAWSVGLAAGSNTVGAVNLAQYTPVSGALPVHVADASVAVTLSSLPALAAGSNVIGHVIVDAAPTTAVTQSGAWTARAQDGAGNALTSLAAGAQRPLAVAVVDASGNQITSFGGSGSGGGTSSNFGSAVPAAGTAAGWSDGTNMQSPRVFDADTGAGTQYVAGVVLRGSASGGSAELATPTNPLRVDPTGTTTQPVSGAVTANAGSGTFAVSAASLPLPTGAATAANQATANTSLASIDGKVTACNTGAVVVSSLPSLAAGSNAIGTVGVTTLPALAPGTSLIGQTAAAQQVNQLFNGTTSLTPKFAAISAATSGDGNTLVAGVGGKKIRVLRYSGNVASAVTAKFRSYNGTTYADLTGAMALVANQPIPGGSYCPVGLFETGVGESLTLNLSAGVQAGGVLTYVEV